MPAPMLHPYCPVLHPEAPKADRYLHRSLHHMPQCTANLRQNRAFTCPTEPQSVTRCKMGPLMAHCGSQHWYSRRRTHHGPTLCPSRAQPAPKPRPAPATLHPLRVRGCKRDAGKVQVCRAWARLGENAVLRVPVYLSLPLEGIHCYKKR